MYECMCIYVCLYVCMYMCINVQCQENLLILHLLAPCLISSVRDLKLESF